MVFLISVRACGSKTKPSNETKICDCIFISHHCRNRGQASANHRQHFICTHLVEFHLISFRRDNCLLCFKWAKLQKTMCVSLAFFLLGRYTFWINDSSRYCTLFDANDVIHILRASIEYVTHVDEVFLLKHIKSILERQFPTAPHQCK